MPRSKWMGGSAGQIGAGLLVLLGIEKGDRETDADHLVRKITGLRIFPDAQGKMNLSVMQTGGAAPGHLAVHSLRRLR